MSWANVEFLECEWLEQMLCKCLEQMLNGLNVNGLSKCCVNVWKEICDCSVLRLVWAVPCQGAKVPRCQVQRVPGECAYMPLFTARWVPLVKTGLYRDIWLGLASLMTFFYSEGTYALRNLCLRFVKNLLSLKASRTLAKIDDIVGVNDYYGNSWMGLKSLMTFWVVGFR